MRETNSIKTKFETLTIEFHVVALIVFVGFFIIHLIGRKAEEVLCSKYSCITGEAQMSSRRRVAGGLIHTFVCRLHMVQVLPFPVRQHEIYLINHLMDQY